MHSNTEMMADRGKGKRGLSKLPSDPVRDLGKRLGRVSALSAIEAGERPKGLLWKFYELRERMKFYRDNPTRPALIDQIYRSRELRRAYEQEFMEAFRATYRRARRMGVGTPINLGTPENVFDIL